MPTLMIIFYPQNSDIGQFNTFAAKAIEMLKPHTMVGILAAHKDNLREISDDDCRTVMAANNTMYNNFSNYLKMNIVNLCQPDDFPFENPSSVNVPKFWLDRLYAKVRYFVPLPKHIRTDIITPGALSFGTVVEGLAFKTPEKPKEAAGTIQL